MKYKKWLKRICLIILLVAILRIGFEKLITQYSNKFISPNKTNTIKIEAREPLNFLMFGPSDIRIKCRKNSFIGFMKGVSINTHIANDGGRINNSNFDIEWINEDAAIITLLGQEQRDEVIKVSFEDDISYE